MSNEITVAIIGACGVILAALIGLFKKSSHASKTTISQRAIGKNNTQVGIQQNHETEDKQHE
jgi:hypothetical protein